MARATIKAKPRGRPRSNTTAKLRPARINKSEDLNEEYSDSDHAVEEQQYTSHAGGSTNFDVLVDDQAGEEYKGVAGKKASGELKRKRQQAQYVDDESEGQSEEEGGDEGASDVQTENAGEMEEYELTTPADKINATPTSSEKRGRGRPPKKQKVELTDFSPAQTYSSPGTERRRGRPPKFPTSVDSPLAIKTASKSEPRASIGSITGRGRGRPPKNKGSPKAKGKVGRPRKSVGDNSLVNFEEAAAKDADEDEGVQVDDYDNEEEEDLEMDTSNVTIAPAPQRRGRGRPPKKATSEAVTVDVEDEGQDDPEAEGEDYEEEFGDDIEGGKKLTVVKQVETVKEVVTMTESAAPRRGPGRPRKNAILPPIVSGNASLQEGNQSVTAAEALTTASTGKRGRGRPSKKTTTGDTGPTLPVPIPGMVPYGSLNEDGTLAEGPYSPGTPFSPPSDADSSFEMFRGPRAPSPNVIPAAATRPAYYYANDSAYEADESSNNYDSANNNAVVPVNSDNDFRRGTTSPIPPAEEANTDNTVPIAKESLAVLQHIRGEKQLQSSSQPEQPPYTPTKPPTSRKASAAAVSGVGAGGSHPISAGGSMNVQQSPDNDGRSNFQSPRPRSKEQPGIITTFFSKLT